MNRGGAAVLLCVVALCALPAQADNTTFQGCGSNSQSGSGTDECCQQHHGSCAEVTENCPLGVGGTSLFNYYHLYYCTMADYQWLAAVILVVWLFVIFSLLASTADNFFVSQLETMSAELRLPPAAAGVTLLALGNSSPDVFSDIAAVQNDDDFAMALGELMGASMFLTTVVLGAVTLVATRDGEECTVAGRNFVRDVSVFVVALVAVLLFSVTDGSISLAESFVVIAIYAVYVSIVVLVSRNESDEAEGADLDKEHLIAVPDPERHSAHSLVSTPSQRNDHAQERASRVVALLRDDRSQTVPVTEREQSQEGDVRCVGLDWESDTSLISKIIFVAEYPFSWMRWLSICSSDGEWDVRRRVMNCIAPMGAVCVVFLDFSGNWQSGSPADGFTQKIGGAPVVAIPLAIAAAFGVVVAFCTNNTDLPSWHLLLVLAGFVSTVAWLDLIGNECVAVVEVLGTILGITSTDAGHSIMGVTIIAWANSIGDLVADTAVARAGLPHMGVAGVFGAPLLTCCLGLGLSTVIAASSSSSHTVDSKVNAEVTTSYIFLGVSLLGSMAVITLNKFRVPRYYAYFLFALYAAYMTVSVVVVLRH
eukprot:TRINITY_DN8177_c4_g1_i1.p1 TRINITY_DN8177_c4_g1~~TRINITY_DN8177_c4_g1_i1.p1  ORF type:complete len:593 (+),score=103.32 TRINITY_DN8177_c4_g1_i1:248-2026(+)